MVITFDGLTDGATHNSVGSSVGTSEGSMDTEGKSEASAKASSTAHWKELEICLELPKECQLEQLIMGGWKMASEKESWKAQLKWPMSQ